MFEGQMAGTWINYHLLGLVVAVCVAGAASTPAPPANVPFARHRGTVEENNRVTLRLRGGSSASVVQEEPRVTGRSGGGGWAGAQSYLETTGINITATAGSIAAYRSAVTLCNSSYLDDPFAALFARESCPDRYKEIISLPAPKLVRFAVRTKFFDNFIRDCVHRHGIKQASTLLTVLACDCLQSAERCDLLIALVRVVGAAGSVDWGRIRRTRVAREGHALGHACTTDCARLDG